MKIYTHSTEDGKPLKSDLDFEFHKNTNIAIDVEELNGEGILTTGLITRYDEKMVVINNHAYNRHAHIFVSRPFTQTI